MSDGESTLSQAADVIEEASNHKILDVLARAGSAVMALLHVIVGAIAVAVAFGQPGEADATGAIEQLAANPWGPAVMWACVLDRKSTRLNSSHANISYAVFCLKKKSPALVHPLFCFPLRPLSDSGQ